MRNPIRFYIFILFLTLSFDVIKGQENTKPETFSKFEKIQQDIFSTTDRKQSFALSQQYVELAKAEKNSKELLKAYENASVTATDSIGIKYADSILNLSIKLKDQVEIGNSYFTIGNRSLLIFDYKKAAEFSVISYDYFKSQNSEEFARKSLSTIGKLKSIIGEDQEAQKLFKHQYLYFRKNQINTDNKLWYSNYLTLLILANAKLKYHNENETLIKESYSFYKENKGLNSSKFAVYITDGSNDFYMGRYESAILKIKTALVLMNKTNYQVSDNFNFLLAQCYWKSGQIEKAFPIFKQIRDNYFKTKKTSLAFRPAFDFFTEYYKKNGNTEQQLASLNDLLEYDKYEKDIRSDVQLKLKEFDEKYKIEEGNNAEKKQTFSDFMSYAIIFLSSLAVIYYVIKKVKSNKKPEIKEFSDVHNLRDKKFTEENLQPKTTESFHEDEIDYNSYRPINKLTVDQIIIAMKMFEKSLGYLEQDLKLTALAQKFNTNDKYLSKVIKIKTGKTFNAYLTDLRFEYLDEKLKTDPQFRNQKIKDISSKLGFGSPEFFATAFKEKYGKSPKEFFDLS
ncbi:helix-turn-helix domain-containing protein [Chryseobacterium sp.]|uniref:helix-turn-helix domain-containing protein n=1 Tax=Chryseobacterium sp. TaxID=1871047 RepID=UPI00388DB01F